MAPPSEWAWWGWLPIGAYDEESVVRGCRAVKSVPHCEEVSMRPRSAERGRLFLRALPEAIRWALQ